MKLNSIRKGLDGKVRKFSPTKISSFTVYSLIFPWPESLFRVFIQWFFVSSFNFLSPAVFFLLVCLLGCTVYSAPPPPPPPQAPSFPTIPQQCTHEVLFWNRFRRTCPSSVKQTTKTIIGKRLIILNRFVHAAKQNNFRKLKLYDWSSLNAAVDAVWEKLISYKNHRFTVNKALFLSCFCTWIFFLCW